MCTKIKEEDAMKLRANINALLKKAKVPKPNLTKEERIWLLQLKKDKDKEYISKAEELLAQPAYRTIPKDPTNKIKAQLITKLRRIKKENNLDEGIIKPCIPQGVYPQSFMGYQKSIKLATPSGP